MCLSPRSLCFTGAGLSQYRVPSSQTNKSCMFSTLYASSHDYIMGKLLGLCFRFEYFLKLWIWVFLFGSFLSVIFLTINQWEMLFSERKWHDYVTYLLSSLLTGLVISLVFTVYSSARDKINLFSSGSIIWFYKNAVLEQFMGKSAKASEPFLTQAY